MDVERLAFPDFLVEIEATAAARQLRGEALRLCDGRAQPVTVACDHAKAGWRRS